MQLNAGRARTGQRDCSLRDGSHPRNSRPQHEVFLIDAIERNRVDEMPHLKAIYFIRPTQENVQLLQEEFKKPKYGEYHIFFSNLTRDGLIQQLAEADEHEVVQQASARCVRTEAREGRGEGGVGWRRSSRAPSAGCKG